MIVPVIVAGGKGLRLWPHSRQDQPKPFVSVSGLAQTLLQATLRRLAAVRGLQAPLVVCNASHEFLVQAQAAEAGIHEIATLLEPEGRNTAPALCAAALLLAKSYGSHAIMLALPADHQIADEQAFAAAVAAGAELAGQDYLVTFAMKATRPATGYGYLKLGRTIDAAKQQFLLDAFVEKPKREMAESFLASGGYAWNSGMFMFKLATLLKSFEELQPSMLVACRAALPEDAKLASVKLHRAPFLKAPSISVDYAVMERAANVATVVAELGWSDVGDWDAVWQISPKDATGVAAGGNVQVIDSRNSIVHSDGPLVVGLGLDDMIAIGTQDAVLVAPRSHAQDVAKVVDALAELGRKEAASGRKILRPWGWYETLHAGPGFQVKEIAVNPGSRVSLQRHKLRAEHWVCTSGHGIATRGEARIDIGVNDAVDIPLGCIHRLENPGSRMLHIIEVQIGGYTGEDDIERLEDDYGRG